jgi:hypothetical protein
MSRRRVDASKYDPALRYGRVKANEVADDSITPKKLDRNYIEGSFGQDAEGLPPDLLRQIIRLWQQDGKIKGETTD